MFHLIRVNRNRGTCEYEKSRVVPMVGFKADGIPQFGSELPYPCFSGKYNDFIFIFPQLAIFRSLSWLFFVSSVGENSINDEKPRNLSKITYRNCCRKSFSLQKLLFDNP